MLGFFVRPRLLCLCNSTIIVTIEVIGLEQLGTTPNSETNFLIHIASFVASEATIYSASVVAYDRLFLGTFLTHCPTVEADDIS